MSKSSSYLHSHSQSENFLVLSPPLSESFPESELEVVPEALSPPPPSDALPFSDTPVESQQNTYSTPPLSQSISFPESEVEVVPESCCDSPPFEALPPSEALPSFEPPSTAVDPFLPPEGEFVLDSPTESDSPKEGERCLDYWEAIMEPSDPYYWLMTQCVKHRNKRKAEAAASGVIRSGARRRRINSSSS